MSFIGGLTPAGLMGANPVDIIGNLGGSMGAMTDPANGSAWRAQGLDLANYVDPMANQNVIHAGNQQQAGLDQQLAFAKAAAAQNGFGNQSQVFGQQQALANQLQAGAMGQGPNPVQAQLAQNTGQNIAAQSAMMAGQRGASSNVGLQSRQIAQQGANTQQQAVGQAATLGAQQQQAYQQALMQQQAQMAALANSQIAQQSGATNAYTQAAQNNYRNNLDTNQQVNNAIAAQNNARAGLQGSMNSANSGVAQANIKGTSDMIGGIMSGAGQAAMMAHGGKVPAKSKLYAHLNSKEPLPKEMYAIGGNVGGNVGEALKSGGHVPGQAAVKGDSLKNDIVDAKLSPGEFVVPRSVMDSKDPKIQAALKLIQEATAK